MSSAQRLERGGGEPWKAANGYVDHFSSFVNRFFGGEQSNTYFSKAPSLAEIQQEQSRKPQQPQQQRAAPQSQRPAQPTIAKLDEDRGFFDYGDEEEVCGVKQ